MSLEELPHDHTVPSHEDQKPEMGFLQCQPWEEVIGSSGPLIFLPTEAKYLRVDERVIALLKLIAAHPQPRDLARAWAASGEKGYDLRVAVRDLVRAGLVKIGPGPTAEGRLAEPFRVELRHSGILWTIGYTALLMSIWLLGVIANGDQLKRLLDWQGLVHLSTTNGIFAIIATFLLVGIVHEGGHAMAMSSYGLPARFGFSRRGISPVFTTNVDHARRLQPRQQALVFLAGSVMNIAVFATAGIVGLALQVRNNPNGVWALMVQQVAVLSLLFQFRVSSKTDYYYLLSLGLKSGQLADRSADAARHLLHAISCTRCRIVLKETRGRMQCGDAPRSVTGREFTVCLVFLALTATFYLILVGTAVTLVISGARSVTNATFGSLVFLVGGGILSVALGVKFRRGWKKLQES